MMRQTADKWWSEHTVALRVVLSESGHVHKQSATSSATTSQHKHVMRERPLLRLRHSPAETLGMATTSDAAVTYRAGPDRNAGRLGLWCENTTMGAKNRTANLVDRRRHKTTKTMTDEKTR